MSAVYGVKIGSDIEFNPFWYYGLQLKSLNQLRGIGYQLNYFFYLNEHLPYHRLLLPYFISACQFATCEVLLISYRV